MRITCGRTKGCGVPPFDRVPVDKRDATKGLDSIDSNCCRFDKQQDTVSKGPPNQST